MPRNADSTPHQAPVCPQPQLPPHPNKLACPPWLFRNPLDKFVGAFIQDQVGMAAWYQSCTRLPCLNDNLAAVHGASQPVAVTWQPTPHYTLEPKMQSNEQCNGFLDRFACTIPLCPYRVR